MSGLLTYIFSRLTSGPDPTLGTLRTASGLFTFLHLLEIPSALVAMTLVGHITRWQSERFAQVKLNPESREEAPADGFLDLMR